MKNNFLAKLFFLFILNFSLSFAFSQNASIPDGYKELKLGMSLEQVKNALENNMIYGYSGERDISLLPTENRVLIETDASKYGSWSFISKCYFQFYEEKLYIITIELNTQNIDHYSVFSTLMKKYGKPSALNPEKSTWQNDKVIMSLERPLTLRYTDKIIFDKLQEEALVKKSFEEITREDFLEGL
jgi:hypothetical protein